MDNDKTREPYEPPTVEDVPFRLDEQVLAGCKGPKHSGATQPNFNCIGVRGTCRQITSS